MALFGLLPAQQGRQEPFQWGQGGRRMSQDDIALQRRLAAQQMQQGADYSPLGHWTQGLARVAQGLSGGLNMRRADRAAEANRTAEQEIIENLFPNDPETGARDPVGAALAVPELRQMAMKVWEARQPQAADDKDAVVRLSRIANDPAQPEWLRRDAAAQLEVLNDPLSVITNSAGTQILPRSVLLNGEAGGPAAATLGSSLPEGWSIDESHAQAPKMVVTPGELNTLVVELGPAAVQARLDSGELVVRGR